MEKRSSEKERGRVREGEKKSDLHLFDETQVLLRRAQLRLLPPFCVADAAGARRGDACTERQPRTAARVRDGDLRKGGRRERQ